MEQINPLPNPSVPPETPINPPTNPPFLNKSVLIILLIVFVVILSFLVTYLLVKSQTPSKPSPAPIAQVNPTPSSVDETVNWKTYKNNELQYEFQYPPNPLEPQGMEGDISFVIGYFINGGNPNSLQDVQNPDKTYWISLGYISQAQLDLMGITYCGAHSNDSSRCETITIGGVSGIIDWNLPVEYTKINPNGKEEKAIQIKATVWISHPKEGVVTFELQPVVSRSKEILYQILSTFKFLDENSISSIAQTEVEKGWYWGNADQKKTGTPENWLFQENGKSSCWHKPDTLCQ